MLLSDKSNYTFQLYQIFQQYPDTLLMAVFFSMRDDQMVSKVKNYVRIICSRKVSLKYDNDSYNNHDQMLTKEGKGLVWWGKC